MASSTPRLSFALVYPASAAVSNPVRRALRAAVGGYSTWRLRHANPSKRDLGRPHLNRSGDVVQDHLAWQAIGADRHGEELSAIESTAAG